jgi:hypothetical protein
MGGDPFHKRAERAARRNAAESARNLASWRVFAAARQGSIS